MADTTTYFGNAVPATYPDRSPIIVNGRPLLIPENYSLQQQVDAAHFTSAHGLADGWFLLHFPPGSSGDPQRQAGFSGGFDPTFTDAGNYGYGLSAAAAGYDLAYALEKAADVNLIGAGKTLPMANERAIRQAYNDYHANRFMAPDSSTGRTYLRSVAASDLLNGALLGLSAGLNAPIDISNSIRNHFWPQIAQTDVQRYALKKWGNLDSPDAQATMANFQQAFGGYPQHLDLNLLQPLPADGKIPSGKDVSLFVGRDGQVLVYARPSAPGGSGALRGIYGLDGGPNGSGSTGLNFFEDGTPRPASVRPHLATPSDPTGGIDVTLANGAKEHWWSDPIDGFKRDRTAPSPDNSSTFADRFGSWGPLPGSAASPGQRPASRMLSRDLRAGGQHAGTSPFVRGAPAVPFVSKSDGPFAPALPASFDNRFGNWVSSPPLAPQQPLRQPQSGGSTSTAPGDIRVLRRVGTPNDRGAGSQNISTSRIPNPSPAQPAGAASRPVPDFPVPPAVYGLPDASAAAAGDNMDDWFDRWIRPLMQP